MPSSFTQWYLNSSTTLASENGNLISVPSLAQEWHRDSVTIHKILYRMIRRPSAILSEPYLIGPSRRTVYCLFHTASNAPSPAVTHIWKFPTPAPCPEAAPHQARSLSGTVSTPITPFLAGFHRFFFAITYVYSLCVLLIGCILAVKSEKVI